MADNDLKAELETMRADMAKLRADFAGVAAALKGAGAAEAEGFREKTSEFASNLKEQLKCALEECKEKGKKSVEVVEKQVGEHPFLSLLAAFGAGFIVAKLLDNRK